MQKNNLLDPDVDLATLAKELKNFTGAEIEAIVKSANSFSLNRHHNLLDFSQNIQIVNPGTVNSEDFKRALEEITPEFGIDKDKLDQYTN